MSGESISESLEGVNTINPPKPRLSAPELHKNYCSHCPHIEIIKDGKRTCRYTYHPEKCHYCTTKSFTDKLSAYVNLDYDIQKFRDKREAAQKGMAFSNDRKKAIYNQLLDHCKEGQTRVIDLCGITVILDWTGDNGMRILFARPERRPDA